MFVISEVNCDTSLMSDLFLHVHIEIQLEFSCPGAPAAGQRAEPGHDSGESLSQVKQFYIYGNPKTFRVLFQDVHMMPVACCVR